MGCAGPSKTANPIQRERLDTVKDEEHDQRTFAEKINAIEINEDPHECIADLRMVRKTRELRPKGFLQRVMNKGKTPNVSFHDNAEEDGHEGAAAKRKKSENSDDEYIYEDIDKEEKKPKSKK